MEVDEENVPLSSTDLDVRLAQLYASLTCMIADPNFRDGFWEGENGWENEADDTAKMNAIYQRYGFADEAAVATL